MRLALAALVLPLALSDAAQCWKESRESARVPEELEVNPPPCDAIFKGKPSHLFALPAEFDLTAPKSLRFRAGAATCAESP